MRERKNGGLDRLLEEGDGRTEVACVRLLGNHALASRRGNHVNGSLGAETVDVDVRAVNLNHVLLAVLRIRAGLSIVLKEAVQISAVDEQIRGVHDTQTPGLLARGRRAGREVGIVPGVLGRVGNQSCGVGLVVWSLSLDQTHEDVRRVRNLVQRCGSRIVAIAQFDIFSL